MVWATARPSRQDLCRVAQRVYSALSTAERRTRSEGEPLDKTTYTYTHLIGSLLYLSVCTRPDIAQAVGALSKYMAEPTTLHWQAAKGLMQYVASTREQGILHGTDSNLVIGYCDADYAGDLDTRRSPTAFVFVLRSYAIAWRSHHLAEQAPVHCGSVHN